MRSDSRVRSASSLLLIMNLFDGTYGFSAAAPKLLLKSHFIGVDLGTSGARISVIENEGGYREVYAQNVQWNTDAYGAYDEPDAWCQAVNDLLQGAADALSLESVCSICISGTSASCLLSEQSDVDDNNNNIDNLIVKPTRSPRMYNYNVDNAAALKLLSEFVPERHTARSSTGSLAKLLAWHFEQPVTASERLCHQADYVTRQFLATNDNVSITSDWHNCLKLGYDVRSLTWPLWLMDCLRSVGVSEAVLPAIVVSPGEPIGPVRPDICQKFGLSTTTLLVGGTTDSNAAFLAATGGSAVPGTAVTSLGSTLAIKQLSTCYVEDAARGVYSHRFPAVFDSLSSEAWLVGGASNVGCAVLRAQGFSDSELERLSHQIDPSRDSPLSYYPLTRKGERFPEADSDKEPILVPVPDDRGEFLHGILQGISDVERDGFLALGELGACPSTPSQVWTCGGGSKNDVWSQLRQRRLREAFGTDESVHVTRAVNVEASYGAAILAAASFAKL